MTTRRKPEPRAEPEGLQLTMTQKIVAGLISAVLLWTGYTTQQTSVQVAVLDAKVESATDLRNRVNTIEADNAAARARTNALADRITALEQKVNR